MEDVAQAAAFVSAADTLHLGRAAAACGIARSTVAARLRALEARLGLSLIDRRHRCRIALTPAGCALLPAARRVLAAAGEFERRAAEVREGRRGVVRVALTSPPDARTRAVVDAVRRAHPGWSVSVRRMDRRAVGRLMAVGGVECAVGLGVPPPVAPTQIVDPRPNRLERSRSVVVPGPRSERLAVTWRESWGAPDASGARGAAELRHREALVETARALRRRARDAMDPRGRSRRRGIEARRAAVAREVALMREDTVRYGADVAMARALARDRQRWRERGPGARGAGENDTGALGAGEREPGEGDVPPRG